ncbi:MAG: tetratricopeptide repeat protein [Treponema sp.]|nr:tetratricopeptide repeat protein [Treponema sp.]
MNENLIEETEELEQNFELTSEDINDSNEKITELSKKGYQLLKEDDIENATQAFKAILEIEDNNNYALVGLGDTERKQNHFNEAISYYNKCLIHYPSNNYALFGLASCYKALNQYSKAIQIWLEYLQHDDKNITVITRVADAYRKIKDYKKSKDFYLKVLEMQEDNAYALIGLGHLNYDFKEYREALSYWTRIYEINKESVDIRVLTSIGNCHRKLKTFDQGIVFFEKALESEPNNFYALFGLADCYRGLKLHEKSIIYWNKILESDPKNKVILTRVGDAYRTTGHLDEAEKYYNRALDIDFDIYAAIGLALLCMKRGKYEEAEKRFRTLILNDPKNPRLYIDLSDCYLAMNKKNEAKKLLEDFLKYEAKNMAVKTALDRINRM